MFRYTASRRTFLGAQLFCLFNPYQAVAAICNLQERQAGHGLSEACCGENEVPDFDVLDNSFQNTRKLVEGNYLWRGLSNSFVKSIDGEYERTETTIAQGSESCTYQEGDVITDALKEIFGGEDPTRPILSRLSFTHSVNSRFVNNYELSEYCSGRTLAGHYSVSSDLFVATRGAHDLCRASNQSPPIEISFKTSFIRTIYPRSANQHIIIHCGRYRPEFEVMKVAAQRVVFMDDETGVILFTKELDSEADLFEIVTRDNGSVLSGQMAFREGSTNGITVSVESTFSLSQTEITSESATVASRSFIGVLSPIS